MPWVHVIQPYSLSREVVSLNELLIMFKLSDAPTQTVAPARRTTAPVAVSPVRELGRRLTGAFSGKVAIK